MGAVSCGGGYVGGVGGVGKGVCIVAEEVSEVECVGDGLGDVDGSRLGNMSSWIFYYIFIRCFFCGWARAFYVQSSWLGLRRIGR